MRLSVGADQATPRETSTEISIGSSQSFVDVMVVMNRIASVALDRRIPPEYRSIIAAIA